MALLGPKAKTTPPGTDALHEVFTAAGGRVLVLCDEVLNFVNRHRDLADGFYAFLQNLTVAMTGTTQGAAMISLPRSAVEMTEHDQAWQEKLVKLESAITTDIAGETARTRGLDADTKGPLKDIHRRVGAAILFESSGGMVDKYAHLPELRFALGEPEVDTTSVDNAAIALEKTGFYIRKAGTDGYRFGFHPKLTKVVNDRRASLDEGDVKKSTQALVGKEFETRAAVPLVFFPTDADAIPDSPRLSLVVMDPETEWSGQGGTRGEIAAWTGQRGKSPRLYPAALVWCVRKPGRDLRDRVETWLAWRRVEHEIAAGTLGGEFEKAEKAEVTSKVRDAEETAKDEVWAAYRYMVLEDKKEPDLPAPQSDATRQAGGLKAIDLGAGHASGAETLSGRVITALKSQGLLNDSVGAGYLERNWPPALKETGAWPLSGLRQSFLNGALTRLLDPDVVLRGKIPEFVGRGDFGLASGQRPGGGYDRIWWNELVPPDEVSLEGDVFLLTNARAKALKAAVEPAILGTKPGETLIVGPEAEPGTKEEEKKPESPVVAGTRTLRVSGSVPPEVWNRLGTRLIPKLRLGQDLKLGLNATLIVDASMVSSLKKDLEQALADLGLSDRVDVDIE